LYHSDSEDEEYITRPPVIDISDGIRTYDAILIPPTSLSHSPMPMNILLESELWNSCRSLNCDSAISSSLMKQESSDTFLKFTLKEINGKLRSNIKRTLRGSTLEKKRRTMTNHMKKMLECTDEQVCLEYLATLKKNLGRNSLSPNIIPKDGYNKKSDASKNKSGMLSPNSYLKVNMGMKFSKRLGSLSSVNSTSVSSLEDVSTEAERIEFCEPLSCSFRSSVTNIAYCSDRHFFKSPNRLFTPSPNRLFTPEGTDTLDYLSTPDLEPVMENSETCELITDDAPCFHIEVM